MAALIATTVSDEDDVLEAVHLQAVSNVSEYGLECFLSKANRARAPHMPALGLDATLWDELYYRSADGISEVSRNCWAVRSKDVVVLSGNQPRTVRLYPSG